MKKLDNFGFLNLHLFKQINIDLILRAVYCIVAQAMHRSTYRDNIPVRHAVIVSGSDDEQIIRGIGWGAARVGIRGGSGFLVVEKKDVVMITNRNTRNDNQTRVRSFVIQLMCVYIRSNVRN